MSNLTQVSQVTSDQHAEVTHISGLPPGVSLIQADQGQDGEGAIFLLVTGPVDGEGGPANAIAVDAATAAAMASLQNPLEAVTSGQAITIEELATAVSTSRKSQSDSVAEILSGLTGEFKGNCYCVIRLLSLLLLLPLLCQILFNMKKNLTSSKRQF